MRQGGEGSQWRIHDQASSLPRVRVESCTSALIYLNSKETEFLNVSTPCSHWLKGFLAPLDYCVGRGNTSEVAPSCQRKPIGKEMLVRAAGGVSRQGHDQHLL